MAATLTLADIQRKYGDSVYPLYKDQMHEPYMEGKNGIGIIGGVLYNEREDKLQCSYCGKWLDFITAFHLKKHGISTPTEYKIKYGLLKKVSLCNQKTSRKMSQNGINSKNGKNLLHGRHSQLTRERISVATKRSANSIGYKNTKGLCDAQIDARFLIAIEALGKEFVTRELREFDYSLMQALITKYGTLNKAKEQYNLNTKKSMIGLDKTKIIASLRKFVVDYGRIPTSKDQDIMGHGNYVGLRTVYKHFGSWRRAKMMAGLDQLLQEEKNNDSNT